MFLKIRLMLSFRVFVEQEEQKREKEVVKKAIKKERKQLRGICKDANFFADDEVSHLRTFWPHDNLFNLFSHISRENAS